MMKKIELRQASNGEMYPVTYPEYITDNTGQTLDNTLSEINETLATKADISELSNVKAEEVVDNVTLQEFGVTREELKKDLFIDMWNSACGNYGKYNAETGYFELNGLTDISYEEAVGIYNMRADGSSHIDGAFCNYPYRTNMFSNNKGWIAGTEGNRLFLSANKLIVAYIIGFSLYKPLQYTFYGCNKLVKIIGGIDLAGIGFEYSAFRECYNLEEVKLSRLRANIDMRDCAKLSYDSVKFLISDSINYDSQNKTIVTIHQDIMAKLTDTSNTEWNSLLTLAETKNIQFATI